MALFNTKQGFSLIEVVVAIAIISLVSIAFLDAQRDLVRWQGFFAKKLDSNREVQRITGRFVDEVRAATSTAEGIPVIASATPTEFIFYTDSNADGVPERIRYTLVQDSIERGVIEATETPPVFPVENEQIAVVITNVVASSSLFAYYASSTEPLVDDSASSMRMVEMSFDRTGEDATRLYQVRSAIWVNRFR